MRPEERQINPSDPRGQIQAPSRDDSGAQTAAANVARSQLDSIYSGPQSQPGAAQNSEQLPAAYRRTHENKHSASAEQWKQYHTAWQEYYQKYYEHYYVGAVQQAHQAIAEQASAQPAPHSFGAQTGEPEIIDRSQAMNDLRSQLLTAVSKTAKNVRGSRHFIPLTAAIIVLMLFSFMQYNRAIIANVKAYVTPGEIDPQSIVVDPNAELQVGPEPLLDIPKINVKVPVNYDTTPDQASQLKAMENGVAYFGIPGANSKPGQVGNTVISGHSSNDFIDTGSYKFVFALLERLKPEDIFYLHYEGVRYTYRVTKTQVVKPTDVSALVYPTDKPIVTLITCTPLGTALNRLLVTGEQVSPSPSSAATAPADAGQAQNAVMPGNSPTVLERLFSN